MLSSVWDFLFCASSNNTTASLEKAGNPLLAHQIFSWRNEAIHSPQINRFPTLKSRPVMATVLVSDKVIADAGLKVCNIEQLTAQDAHIEWFLKSLPVQEVALVF